MTPGEAGVPGLRGRHENIRGNIRSVLYVIDPVDLSMCMA